jgi:hypothetical protein
VAAALAAEQREFGLERRLREEGPMNVDFPRRLVWLLAVVGCGSAAGEPDLTTPIATRPSRHTFACRIARDRTDHSPRQWQRQQALVVTTGGVAYLAREEGTADNPISPVIPGAAQLIVSRFDADGTFGPPVVVSNGDAQAVTGVAITRVGEGFGVLWVEGGQLRFATFGAGGQLRPPVRVVSTAGFGVPANPRIAEGPGGSLGVVYSTTASAAERPHVIFLTMNEAGAIQSGPRQLGDGPPDNSAPAAGIAASEEGYAVVWHAGTGALHRIDFARSDAAGTALGTHALSPPQPADIVVGGITGFDAATIPILAVPGGYLAAWTEVKRTTYPTMGAWSVVKVARLDTAGVVLGTPAPLRAPEPDTDEVEPALTKLGDSVAVTWARGSRIYVCGGCIPDHRIDMLLVDPASLAPLADVLTIQPGPTARSGGLLRRDVAAVGSSLLATFNLTFHVHATPGSATFACDPR